MSNSISIRRIQNRLTEIFDGKITTINNAINEVCNKIDELVDEEKFLKETLINEAIENTNE